MTTSPSTDELVAQAQAADTTDQLDAIQAASQDPAVSQAVQDRRAELNTRPVTGARSTTRTEEPLGPFAKTEPDKPKEHYFLATDGKTKINAWGEEKGSPEDKKRW